MTLFGVSYVLLWIIVILQGAALFALYHHFADQYLASREGRASQGPALGTVLRDLPTGGSAAYNPRLGQPTLVLFMSTTCKICERLRADVNQFASQHGDIFVDIICAGSTREVERWSDVIAPRVRVFSDPGYRGAAAIRIGMTPFIVGLDGTGKVRVRGLVNEEFGLEWALAEVREEPVPIPAEVAR